MNFGFLEQEVSVEFVVRRPSEWIDDKSSWLLKKAYQRFYAAEEQSLKVGLHYQPFNEFLAADNCKEINFSLITFIVPTFP